MRFADRESLEREQLRSLRRLLKELEPSNPFYGPRLREAGLGGGVASLEEFRRRLPLTHKAELIADQERHPPYGTNLTYPLERYVRSHQTSGTSGSPLRWLDTRESWEWMLDAWVQVYEAAGIDQRDRVFFPFSFGMFLGFWTAFDAAQRLGCLTLAGGGMGSSARLKVLIENRATVVCCTPTYGLRLAEVAASEGLDLASSAVRAILVAGEAGGSVPAMRERLERAWGARVFDHHGMTEVGPVSVPNRDFPGLLHILEGSYLAEIVDPSDGSPVAPGTPGELVLTTLGRLGSPLLRYRTGDLVRASVESSQELGRPEMALEGGVLARTDDMAVVRGVNLYPSAIEQILLSQPGVAEHRVELDESSSLIEVRVKVEQEPGVRDTAQLAARLEAALRNAFHLRIGVEVLPPGSLPRFELKAKRWVRLAR